MMGRLDAALVPTAGRKHVNCLLPNMGLGTSDHDLQNARFTQTIQSSRERSPQLLIVLHSSAMSERSGSRNMALSCPGFAAPCWPTSAEPPAQPHAHLSRCLADPTGPEAD
jgi:hypothetical protein